MTHHADKRFVALAAIAQPHGVHGRVKLKLFTESLESFEALLPHLMLENGTPLHLRITSQSAGMPVAHITEIKDRHMAGLWRGNLLGVHREYLPDLEDDAYYHEDLIGMRAQDAQGVAIGVITSIDNYGAGDIATIRLENGDESLLLLNAQNFPHIDVKQAFATVCMPDEIIAKATDEPAS
jgi:16S rRNA processing protein RimM